MKKLMEFGLSLVFLVFLLLNLVYAVKINEMNVMASVTVSAIKINEIELNPEGSDSGNEWLELFSEQEVNLNGWKLVNNDNEIINLSQSFRGYLIVNFSGQWLDNSDEKIILKDSDGGIVDETELLSDSYNEGRTWQYCNGNWTFASSTKGLANSCSLQNQSQNNNQQNNTNQTPQQQEMKISLELGWEEDEIVNREDFEIEIKAYNLKEESYDVKVYIAFKNETIISETYDEKENEWKSSSYYVNNILFGVGDKSKSFGLRIKEKYRNFSGNAEIGAKIKKSTSSSIIAEIKKDIEILESEEAETGEKGEQNSKNKTQEEQKIIETVAKQTSNVIKLGNRSKIQEQAKEKSESKKEESKIIYESKSEKIKKYAIYALNLILIVIIILLLKSRKM